MSWVWGLASVRAFVRAMPKAQLHALQVDHIGPIEHATLEFSDGLNVLTGETGAGKTLLVGALTLCAGESDERGLRHGGALRASALFLTGDAEISLTRTGDERERLRSSIDGLVVSAKALEDAASQLMVIYGQSASQRLRTPAEALRIIDAFGVIDTGTLVDARRELAHVESQLKQLGGDSAGRERETEYSAFQLRELASAELTSPDELEAVLERLTALTALRENRRGLLDASALLDGDDASSASAQLHRASRALDSVAPMVGVSHRLRAMSDEVIEIAHDISSAADGSVEDEREFNVLEARATQLHAIVRKFGGSLAEALVQQRQLKEALARLESADARARELDGETRRLVRVIQDEASRVRIEREAAARSFVGAVSQQLKRVTLPTATVEVLVTGEDGSDVTIMFSADRQRRPGPLHQLASGGELARVLLAISLETLSDGVVAVFDEVDAGIGGAVAEQIGECLHELATRQQVIVVTHLASIAALADRHFVVRGSTTESPHATVSVVSGEDRITEIARMLAGESAPREARALADQLLARGGSPF
jgi:DNA repair protein RecN (Recombination protein N)